MGPYETWDKKIIDEIVTFVQGVDCVKKAWLNDKIDYAEQSHMGESCSWLGKAAGKLNRSSEQHNERTGGKIKQDYLDYLSYTISTANLQVKCRPKQSTGGRLEQSQVAN